MVLGMIFRFSGLGQKIYWIDETYTSLRIAGYSETELVAEVYDGDVLTVADLYRYQQPQRPWRDTLRSLTDSPQHPPLYFLIGRVWTQFWGSDTLSPIPLRSLSALFSLLIFPAVYWLGQELFEQPEPRWLAIAFVAVSPFQVLYAQEARQYSLWMVLTIASGATLLRAMRHKQPPNNWLNWGLYALLLTTSFYTFLLTAMVALSHGAIVAVASWRDRSTRLLWPYLLASAGAIALFSPWLWVMAVHARRVTSTASWVSERFSLDWLILRWLLYPINQFLDLNLGDRYLTSPAIVLMLAIAILIAYSIYWTAVHAPTITARYLVLTASIPALLFILPDVVLGGQRSGTARYMMPVYFSLLLAVAYTLAERSRQKPHPIRWRILTVALLSCGILSCGISRSATLWWNKSPDKHLHNDRIVAAVQDVIIEGDRPILVSDDSTELSDCYACRMLTLSYELPPDLRLQLVQSPHIPTLPTDARTVLVFSPDRALVREIERQGFRADLRFEEDNFWLWELRRYSVGFTTAPSKM
jgi:uncharacterized membrane protein